VSNGLGSPLCSQPVGIGGLSALALRDCRTSGFLAAPAPTSNYAFDVNIEHEFPELNALGLFQEYILAPAWMGLVWVVHALLVMLEWCYTLDLLDSGSTLGQVGRGLRGAQATFTAPWLVSALAVASILTLYHGLVRRQVAQSLGQALTTVAMMACGLWMIADPAATVGALARWANQASLGALGAIAQGNPTVGARPLSEGLGTVFADGIEGPWCYMEFGNVRWCRDPALLDPRLRAAGLRLARDEQAKVGCSAGSELASRFANGWYTTELFSVCAARGSEQAQSYLRSAALLQEARNNGELFLALAANGLPRNSVSTTGALLNVLCGSSEMKSCHGPTAAQAEFRGAGATGQRAAGLLLILVGDGGMVLVLGFVALHLLGAALLSLIYLLLAPAAVLAPALGEVGRAVFRSWIVRLLGAVVSKLLFSLLLGMLLVMVRILLSLRGLGWWTQWLLVSALWWSAWRQRHQALQLVHGEHRLTADRRRSTHSPSRSGLLRQVAPGRNLLRAGGWIKGRLSQPAPEIADPQTRALAVRNRARAQTDEQAGRMLEREHDQARAQLRAAPLLRTQLAERERQLARVRKEHVSAHAAGDTRREARLQLRARRIEGEIVQRRQSLADARRTVGEGERAQRGGGRVYTRESLARRARFLDAQAALGAGGQAAEGQRATQGQPTIGGQRATQGQRAIGGQRRDYAALAALAGYGVTEYRQLDPARRRAARLQIDRELALRRELRGATGNDNDMPATRQARGWERSVGEQGVGGRVVSGRGQSPGVAQPADVPPSPVMRDIHEVAQRRKRQLGRPSRGSE
jgi:hypothetical protein